MGTIWRHQHPPSNSSPHILPLCLSICLSPCVLVIRVSPVHARYGTAWSMLRNPTPPGRLKFQSQRPRRSRTFELRNLTLERVRTRRGEGEGEDSLS